MGHAPEPRDFSREVADHAAVSPAEAATLRSHLRDLVALLALPVVWSGRDAAHMAEALLDVLSSMLRLDLAYIRATGPAGASRLEAARVEGRPDLSSRPQEVGGLLAGWLTEGESGTAFTLPHPVTGELLHVARIALSLEGHSGAVIVASRRADFPTSFERFLLQSTVTQGNVALHSASLMAALRESNRLADQALRQAEAANRAKDELNAELEQRVGERTRQLTATNEELSNEIVERRRAIEDLERAEAKLRQDEQELRRITDAIPQAIMVLSPEGTAVYANRAVLEYTGRMMDEVMAPDFRTRIFHPEDVARLEDERRERLERGEPFEAEQRARRKDGQYRWFLIRYHPLRDERGHIVRWYATGTDIDDRKRAEDRMRNENLALREDIDRVSMFEEIVGSSASLRRVLAQVAKVAPTGSTVLITGESGTGKELVARAIHKRSSRSARAFVSVSCAAVPPSLIASELFGHEKGAFTGAVQRRQGRFELAEGGTLFLDEVGELPAETQLALLRVLQEHEFERVGGSRPIQADVRVISATNRDLQAAVAANAFRADLFYRLNVFPLELPPLRDRRADIPLLVEYFIHRYARRAGKKIRGISRKTLDLLQSYGWPGNIRELQNVIERAVIISDTETLSVDEAWLAGRSGEQAPVSPPLGDELVAHEKARIEAALKESRGRVSGTSGAAARLGLPRSTLESKIRSLGINKHRFSAS